VDLDESHRRTTPHSDQSEEPLQGSAPPPFSPLQGPQPRDLPNQNSLLRARRPLSRPLKLPLRENIPVRERPPRKRRRGRQSPSWESPQRTSRLPSRSRQASSGCLCQTASSTRCLGSATRLFAPCWGSFDSPSVSTRRRASGPARGRGSPDESFRPRRTSPMRARGRASHISLTRAGRL
jgi:hypothetical protein